MKDYKYTKECELCGEIFKTNRKSKIYCKKPHPVNCAVCNEVVNINKPQRGRKEYPCKKQECRSEMTRRTNIKKYGVPNVAQAKSVQESIKRTNLEKYGVEHAFQSDEVKKKIKQTNIERYGTENPRWGNEESSLKAEKTNLERYGHINPFGGEEIKKQIMGINLEKYGVPQNESIEKKNINRTKLCEFCNKEFVYSQKTQKFCKRKHTSICEFCGDEFEVERLASFPRTCSRKCRSNLVLLEKSKGEKMKKKCEFCGDEFLTTNITQKYCKKDHKKECEVCGKTFIIKKLNAPSRTCGQSCGSVLTHTESSKETRKQRSLEKYGVEHPFQAEIVKEKIEASLVNYESNTRFGSKKMNKLIKDKYGVDNISQLNSVKEKKKMSCMESFGVENPMMSENVIVTRKENMINRYGVDRKKYVNVKNVSDFINLKSFLNNKELDVWELCNYFDVKRDKMLREIREQSVQLLVRNYGGVKSLKEENFKKFIRDTFPNIKVINNDRKVLKGKELDFYFPDRGLAVEISPTSTHNTKMGFADNEGLSKGYHRYKFETCERQDIELITIFDWYDWDEVMKIIISKLGTKKAVGITQFKYCEYNAKDISNKEFTNNHLCKLNLIKLEHKDKFKISKITSNDDLIALAAWVKIGDSFHIEDFMFKGNFNIAECLSFIIRNVTKQNDVKSITVNTNCDLGNGHEFATIGFNLVEEVSPQVNFYNKSNGEHITQVEIPDFISNLTQVSKYNNVEVNSEEVILECGFLPVYDCGYRKWRLVI